MSLQQLVCNTSVIGSLLVAVTDGHAMQCDRTECQAPETILQTTAVFLLECWRRPTAPDPRRAGPSERCDPVLYCNSKSLIQPNF